MRWPWRRDPNRCRVDVEWGGLFIGRSQCHAHNVVWEQGGPCPDAGLPSQTHGLEWR